METYTIEQKQSNSGSIHDLASDCFDRDIVFPTGCRYAVVLASYYGGKGYTCHKTEKAAIKKYYDMKDWSRQIIDSSGCLYAVHSEDRLEKVNEKCS